MMMSADYHTHTKYSFDSETEPEALVLAALENGITSVAVTDHLDIDCADCGLSYGLDHAARRDEIYALKDKYKNKIDILYGLELGQPQNRREEAAELIKNGGFEFVIGSIHNLKYVPDFCYFSYDRMETELIEKLIERYLDETMLLLDTDGIDTLGHITYPLRYAARAGRTVDIKKFYDGYECILRKAIDKGVAIEINTSTLYKGLGFTMPCREIVRLYKDVGGRYVTVGSDAHLAENVGKGIMDAYEMLKSCGFDSVTVKKNGEKQQVKI